MLPVLFSIAAVASVPSYLQDNLVFRGYGEIRFTHSNVTGTPWQSVERLRPTMKWYLHDRVTLLITPQAMLTQGRYEFGEFITLLEAPLQENLPDITLDDIISECEWNLEREREINELDDVLSLPRIHLDITSPYVDVRIGRQSVNWGSAQFFNPTDVLSENLLTSPWQERSGINAIRSTIPLGDNAQVLSIVATDDAFKDWKFAVKGGSNIGSTDLYGVGYIDEQQALLGIDIKGDAIIGFWLEGAYRFFLDDNVNNGDIKISSGIDYSFSVLEQLILTAQVTYDSSGEQDPKYYNWTARQNPDFSFPPCDTYNALIPEPPEEYRQTLGRWYSLVSLNVGLTEAWLFNASTLFNLNDGTGLIFPSIQALAGDRWQFNAGGQFFVGNNGEFRPEATDSMGIDVVELIPTRTIVTWARWAL